MKLQIVGMNHHTATIENRERLAFSPEQTAQALDAWHNRFPKTEAVLLSTCNRVEVYTAAEDSHHAPSHQQVVEFLADFHGLDPYEIFDDLFERTGEDAIRHLFCVAASLDSMVIGEPQILSQVKRAYELATSQQSTGPLSHAVFQRALKVARRVANETSINQRRTSIPSVAICEYAKQIFDRFDDKKVLLIGAGDTGQEALRYLRDEGARDVAVMNRSLERAESVAQEFDGHAVPWERLAEEITAADLIVSTTGAAEPIFTLDDFRKIESARYQRTLLVLDLAVPRDFDAAIGGQLNVYLATIDDLTAICNQNRKAREKEWPAAERLVEDETQAFMSELNHRSTAPTIRRLRESCEKVKQDELARLYNKLPDLDEKARDDIDQSFDRLVNKLLHPPLESLKDEAQHGTPHGLLDALRRLFQLKD